MPALIFHDEFFVVNSAKECMYQVVLRLRSDDLTQVDVTDSLNRLSTLYLTPEELRQLACKLLNAATVANG